ncbi:MAG: DDE-type integrase/transposase/recombinase, partial [Candidatus Heimdallarchaeota archaeon]|nr:DDE-type integrase/transposase/recombinase [Candidatus Heimdallarchaeota archaeon]
MANIWYTLNASKQNENDKYITKLCNLIPNGGITYSDLCNLGMEVFGIELAKSTQIVCYAIDHGLVLVDKFSEEIINNDTIIRKRISDAHTLFHPLEMEFDWSVDMKTQNEPQENDLKFEKSYTFNIPENYKNEVENKLKIINEWNKQPSDKRDKQWRVDFCDKWGISERSVFRWAKLVSESGVEGLIPKHKKKGRSVSYGRDLQQLMEKSRLEFLKPFGTLKKAYRSLVAVCNKNKLDPPSLPKFRYFVYNSTSASELAYNKRGRRFHKSKFSPALSSFQGTIMPMQVLQFDNTPFDVFPVDSEFRETLSTPYLTAAIDCHTGMITGFHLSLSPSSSQTILETLVQSILNKDEYLEIDDTNHTWPISGFPTIILVDNGIDYRSEAVREFCLRYDIILEFAHIRTPRYKAYIEQWFRVLHHGLNDHEVGGLRSLLKYRLRNPDLDPKNDAILTMQEIETWLVKWVVDHYHYTNPYQNNVPAPFLRWYDSQNGQTELLLSKTREYPKLHQDQELMLLHTLNRFDCELNNDGLKWHHLKYNSTELVEVYGQIGSEKITFLQDGRDIRSIWVINPINDRPIRVGLASGW